MVFQVLNSCFKVQKCTSTSNLTSVFSKKSTINLNDLFKPFIITIVKTPFVRFMLSGIALEFIVAFVTGQHDCNE